MVRTQAPLVERMTLVWHDWFATSKDAGPQTLLLRQNALLRRHALGSFERLAMDVTRDPAMLLWLNGTSNHKEDVNENYARELQELFCLGAGRGYTERDVREMARALTGFRNEWSEGRGPHSFRYDRSLHDAGFKRLYGKRGRFDWRDGVRLAVRNRKHPSFLVNKLWGYFIPTPPPRGTARALERMYIASGRNVRPLVRAILRHPHLYDPDRRMTKPPVVQAAGMLRATGRGIDTDAWAWLCDTAGQMLFLPPNVAGWDATRWLDTATFRARWRMAAEICNNDQLDHETMRGKVPTDPAKLVRRAAGFWADTPLSRPTPHGARALRPHLDVGGERELGARVLPRADRERAADADRRLPGLPDLMNPTHDFRVCCAEHARAGAGLPAIERGMPTPAGTGLSRRSFLLRSAGLALSVYGAGRLAGLPVFEEGIARAQAGRAGTVLVSVFLDGGADSMSILAPVGDPNYRRLRPSLALAGGGTPFSEDTRMRWHPAAAPLAALHAEGKVSVMPAVGYDNPDQSHFVSRHYWEVGATDAQMRSGWLGRVIDHIGTTDNPLQGVSMGGSLGPSLAAARKPVAAVDAPEDFGFWAPGAWGPPGELAIPAFADVGRALAGSRDAAVAQAAQAAAFAGGVRVALAPFGNDGEPTYTPRAVYPQSSEERFPRRLAGLAAMLGGRPADPLRDAVGSRRLGHARRPGRHAAGEPEDDVGQPVRLPARPRGARDRRPRAHARVVGVRPPRGGERLGHRPRRRRHRLRHRHARQRPHDRRVPRSRAARPERQPARHVRLPRSLLRALRRLVRRRPRRRARRRRAARAAEGRCGEASARLALALLAALPATAAARPAPARLLVEAREFNLTLSRAKLKSGRAIVQLANRGEDPHDLRLVRFRGRTAAAGSARRSRARSASGTGRLRSGRYRLYCTLEGHRAKGMRATLRVR